MSAAFASRLREFELGLQARMHEFRCSVHLCLGQEGVPAALAELLRPDDYVFSTHRSHGHYLAKCVAAGQDFDAAAARLLAEIEGREEGVNGGFSGSQSFCDPAVRFHSTAVVGGLIGVATGAALGIKLTGCSLSEQRQVTGCGLPDQSTDPERSQPIAVCCIGDGATEQGVFWESANFAALHRLPVVYVCENNGLSVHAPLRLRQATNLRTRVRAFGLEYFRGDCIDGALALARLSRIPAFVETLCERECKHVSAMEDLRE